MTLGELKAALAASGAPDDAVVFVEQRNWDDEPRDRASEVATGFASMHEHIYGFSPHVCRVTEGGG